MVGADDRPTVCAVCGRPPGTCVCPREQLWQVAAYWREYAATGDEQIDTQRRNLLALQQHAERMGREREFFVERSSMRLRAASMWKRLAKRLRKERDTWRQLYDSNTDAWYELHAKCARIDPVWQWLDSLIAQAPLGVPHQIDVKARTLTPVADEAPEPITTSDASPAEAGGVASDALHPPGASPATPSTSATDDNHVTAGPDPGDGP